MDMANISFSAQFTGLNISPKLIKGEKSSTIG